jgi:hypothetical protein
MSVQSLQEVEDFNGEGLQEHNNSPLGNKRRQIKGFARRKKPKAKNRWEEVGGQLAASTKLDSPGCTQRFSTRMAQARGPNWMSSKNGA